MATASVTHTLVDGQTAAAAHVNTNFADLVTFANNSLSHVDGSKPFTNPVYGVPPPLTYAGEIDVSQIVTRSFAASGLGYATGSDYTVNHGSTSKFPLANATTYGNTDAISVSTADDEFALHVPYGVYLVMGVITVAAAASAVSDWVIRLSSSSSAGAGSPSTFWEAGVHPVNPPAAGATIATYRRMPFMVPKVNSTTSTQYVSVWTYQGSIPTGSAQCLGSQSMVSVAYMGRYQ